MPLGGQGSRLLPCRTIEIAAPDPGQGYEIDNFVFVEPVDPGAQFLRRRIIGVILENFSFVVIGRI